MPHDDQVVELLLRYEQLKEQGQAITPEELCWDCPELIDSVRKGIRNLAILSPMLDTPEQIDSIQTPSDPYQTITSNGSNSAETSLEPGNATRFIQKNFHAKGGQGEVYKARDKELGREVALKRIQAPYADEPESRSRFLREAEITGKLEHPGIVPVYGLVKDENGRPCYAMRFIEGESLKDALEKFHQADKSKRDPSERNQTFRELLGRFVSACNTIAYAHSRGILHRDIKPANIMLGKYAATLVVDWGLARTFGRTEAEKSTAEETLRPTESMKHHLTQQGWARGTPAYMSPEQAAGRWDLISPAADIYGLGATLYTLLTGQAPFAGQKDLVLQKVKHGEFALPRSINAKISKPLERICLTAMALKPDDRYTTAKDLADDVGAWLADEAVKAWREPWSLRWGRWMRRHRPLVTAAASLLVTAIIGLATVIILLDKKQKETDEARIGEKEKKELADANLALADANLDLSKKAVDDLFILATNDPLLEEDNMRRVRKALLERALPFYEGFRAQRSEDPYIIAELAKTRFRVGKIQLELSRIAGAEEAFKEAIEAYQQVTLIAPEESENQARLAECFNALGVVQFFQGQNLAALNSYKRALGLRVELVGRFPENDEFSKDLAQSNENLGLLHQEMADIDSSGAAFRAALVLNKNLAKRHSDDPKFQIQFARCYFNSGRLHDLLGQRSESLLSFQESLAIARRLALKFPKVTAYRKICTSNYSYITELQGAAEDRISADKTYNESLETLKELVQGNPDVPDFQAEQARTYYKYGVFLSDSADQAKSGEMYNSALGIQRKLAQEHSDVPQYVFDLARTHRALGNLLVLEKKSSEAMSSYDAALDILKQFVGHHPEIPENRYQLAATYIDVGNLHHHNLAPKKAKEAYEAASDIMKQLIDDNPKVTKYRREQAVCFMQLGIIEFDNRQWDVASSFYKNALELWKRLVEDHPEIVEYRNNLAGTLVNLGQVALKEKNQADAKAYLEEAIPYHKECINKNPKNREYRQYYRENLDTMADVLLQLKNHAQLSKVAEQLEGIGLLEPGDSYKAARLTSLCVQLAKNDDNLSETVRIDLAKQYSDQAMMLLQGAVRKGFKDVARVKKDTDLEPLRQREDFNKLMAELEKK